MTLRIGLFGLLGSGNLGNDGSLAAVVAHLRAAHPDARLDALCGGPAEVTAAFGIPAEPLHSYRGEYRTVGGLGSAAGKAWGKVVDAVRTAAWVRRHDVVIVPGMGVLEATLPLRPWGFPYSLFLLCLFGRLLRTRVALVGVGASNARGATRWLVAAAARLASYRSYRDTLSRDALTAMGVDTSADPVHPDLAFALPVPHSVVAPGTVGVGVMAYRGGNADRRDAERIYQSYVDAMTGFIRWLVDQGRSVRLFTGDRVDDAVVDAIVAAVPGPVARAQVSSLDDLLGQLAAVETVVATRYHNVLCALKVATPTLSVGYAAKNDVLMAEFGVGEFCESAREIDTARLIARFTELERESARVRDVLVAGNAAVTRRVTDHLGALSTVLEAT
jgi:polysaccharide pyruvyl transferase WcaK-like protein